MTIFALASCGGKGSNSGNIGHRHASEALAIETSYAKGFSVRDTADMQLVDIQDPEGESLQTFHLALVPRGEKAEIPSGYSRIDIPVRSVICMTSLQLSNFICLGIPELVSGITSTRHLFNKTVKEQLEKGITHKIGIEGNFDKEVIMSINPDIILISPFKRGGFDAIRDVDIPFVPHLGYKEQTPLGQAEWIKFVGLLTGHQEEANEIFAGIEERYNALKAMAADVETRPVIFSGEIRGGNWYAVGGDSFLAHIFRDAGGEYFLKDNHESGGVTLDYETVYSQAADAPYWRIVNSFDGEYSYEALSASDKRYEDFRAFKEKGVIYCNMKQVPFYERMPVEPDAVLADFIAVLHPELLPEHMADYYHLLK